MPVAGYVGYTVEQRVRFATCAANHTNPLYPPSLTSRLRDIMQTPAMAAGASLWEFVVDYNNRNGAMPIPAGHVVTAHIEDAFNREIPCGTAVQHRAYGYYEKFAERPPPAGSPPGTPGIIRDPQAFFVPCQSVYCYTRTISAAILPEPFAAEFTVPPNEYAVYLNFSDLLSKTPAAGRAALQARINQFKKDFAAAITLKLTVKWEYDHCNTPPATSCTKIHCLEFTAETFDPDRGGARTWITPNAPLRYQSNP